MRLYNENFLFKIIIVDLFLLPYFNIVVIPFSYFAILWWRLNNTTLVKTNKEYNSIFLCIVMMVLSTLMGVIINSQFGVNGDNIKRLVQYILSFEYFFFFEAYFKRYRANLKKICMIFVGFVVVLAVVFQLSPTLFVSITSIWNKGNAYNTGSLLENLNFGYNVRYNFIWTDPNNIAYALTGIIIFVIIYDETNIAERIILLIANIFVLFCCMSSGGWISFAISWGAYLIYAIKNGRLFDKRVTAGSLLGIVLLIITLCIVTQSGILSNFMNSDLVSNAMDRLENNDNSRFEIWQRILDGENILAHLIWGQGSTIYIDGIQRATHSGHLYWIYAYGFISYFIFMKEFFWLGIKKISRYIPIISFFLCFTMNTMVGEQKLFLILILLVCYLRAEEIPNDENYS